MAKSGGRRSLADLNAKQFQSFIQPTRKLSAFEGDVWERVVSAWPADHWIKSDADILTQYCAACYLFEGCRVEGDLAGMDKSGRLTLSYATKLRITPQSRYDTRVASTEAKRGMENEAASDRLLGGNAWAHLHTPS